MSARIVLNPVSAVAATTERAKAQLWLNVGITANGKFVGLPVGIPLDTMEPSKITGNSEFQQYLATGNLLLQRLLERAATLKPGETFEVLGEEGYPAFQIRRVKEEISSSAVTTELVTPW